MLAGIVISVLVVAALAFGLPWLASHRGVPDAVDGDPTERFSDSMRILRRDVVDYMESIDAAEVSTPLTRRAELTELRLLSISAARRRVKILLALVVVTLGVAIASIVGALPWWAGLVPGALIVAFAVVARFSVRTMRRRFDARAEAVNEGYGDEDTETIHLAAEEESVEISVDLAAPQASGALWEPIPVTAPTYVSKPLVPRTVRTIDLSAPVVAASPVVPTADRPDRDVEELQLEDTESIVRDFLPRAVGE